MPGPGCRGFCKCLRGERWGEGKSEHQDPTLGPRGAMRYGGRGDTRDLRFFVSQVTLSRLFHPVGPMFKPVK